MLERVFEKLKHEWKTFSVAVIASIVFGYDALIANGIDYSTIVPDQYKGYIAFAVPVTMLMLRKYT